MEKFLEICEQFDPANQSDPLYDLIDFLKSKGINVSLVRGTNMLYIDTGEKTIAVTVSNEEEEAESIDGGVGTFKVDQEVQNLANTANSGLKGLAARAMGTAPQKAKSAVRKRQQMAGKAVDVYSKSTQELEKALRTASRPSINVNY